MWSGTPPRRMLEGPQSAEEDGVGAVLLGQVHVRVWVGVVEPCRLGRERQHRDAEVRVRDLPARRERLHRLTARDPPRSAEMSRSSRDRPRSVLVAFSAVSMGIAKPMPAALARIAVLMPTTSPNSLSSGPPELPVHTLAPVKRGQEGAGSGPPTLPGLIAASVCMKLTFLFGMPTSAAERDSDEMMPSVTVESSPTALPMAIAQSPTWRWQATQLPFW